MTVKPKLDSEKGAAREGLTDRETQLETEIRTLRALCDPSVLRDERLKLLQSIGPRDFVHTEHHVVFESIRALLLRGEVTAERLTAHLNNRGFPDTDVEQYFQSFRSGAGIPAAKAPSRAETS